MAEAQKTPKTRKPRDPNAPPTVNLKIEGEMLKTFNMAREHLSNTAPGVVYTNKQIVEFLFRTAANTFAVQGETAS